MIFKRPKSAVSNQRGFTLVELMIVMGIFGIIASIALQQVSLNRAKALDTKVVAVVKNLLTSVAIDEPTGGDAPGPFVGGTLAPIGLHLIEVPAGVTWSIRNLTPGLGNNQHDMWMFFLAHEKGKKGYYFWIPGDRCGAVDDSVAGDGSGNVSDYIFYSEDTGAGSFRALAGI